MVLITASTLNGADEPQEYVSVLEALASDVAKTGPNMSNRSTPTAADADDQ